jgi:hypothetical protein
MAYEPLLQKRPKKLLDQISEAMRLKHYAYRTEETYILIALLRLTRSDRTIKILSFLGYADPNDWSDPIPVLLSSAEATD